eukprot:CAMPEP_0170496484 /NCGR_PEP_ID=MMETSP0208-20121228/21742_1 /TAXON_ID=197538 /ORGANISM="Strombidium inclinatum, Strain S3" /LENGTH=62 /DNA_ID=CAMNT_0010773039 /DNA_START=2299 /DNA_END=2486 /DNA_ORIENTATION=+
MRPPITIVPTRLSANTGSLPGGLLEHLSKGVAGDEDDDGGECKQNFGFCVGQRKAAEVGVEE